MLRSCMLGLILVVPALAAQGTHGRIDVYVHDRNFNLSGISGSGMSDVGYTTFLGAGKEQMGVSVAKRLGRGWEKVYVEFTSDGTGTADLQLQGEWYQPNDAKDLRYVWVDDVEVTGASIANGDFETVGHDGWPAGWQVGGQPTPDRLSRDGKVAHHGKSCIAIWVGACARQSFAVEKGKRYRVSAWFRVYDPIALREPERLHFAFPAETYKQEIEIVARDEAAARQLQVEMEPLYNGFDWAVSSRWDDNNGEDVHMRDVLSAHGHHGTFYLNSLWPDWPTTPTHVDSDFGRQLIAKGDSIGSHSLTHPFLSYCNRNRIFEELAGDRMVWEAATDSPVVSHAFSYCNFTNPQEGLAVQADIARCLERGGFFDIANEPDWEALPSDMILSPIMPADGADIDPHVESALASEAFRKAHPNLTYSMHVWYRTPEAWAKFEAQLDKYGHNPRWWYCNQNQYGAYRYQFEHTKLRVVSRQGKVVKVALERPVLLDLNDTVPLTLHITGVPAAKIASVRCTTADLAASAPLVFNLSHDRNQSLPVRIGMVLPNTQDRATLTPDDVDTAFPGLRAQLHFAGGKLILALDNEGDKPVTRLRVTFRLPLEWKEGVVHRMVRDLPPHARREEVLAPTAAQTDYRFTGGVSFYLAQLDFLRGPERGRLYTSCQVKPGAPDRSYPQGGFLLLGPIAKPQLDLGRLAADLRAGRITTQPWVLPDDTRLTWQADGTSATAPYLDPELIRLSGQWGSREEWWMLQTDLTSDAEQTVELKGFGGQCPVALLDGKEIAFGQPVHLKAGTCRLIFAASDYVACWLRVVKPGTNERVTNVRFLAPTVAATEAAPYTPVPIAAVARKALAGKWRGIFTLKLPAATAANMHPDPGLTALAKQYVADAVDDSSWAQLDVPKRWLDYGGDWSSCDGEAVFRREVQIPDDWVGKDLALSLGTIDDFDDTYFNGVLVGRTDLATPDFYAAPRRYTIPAALVRAGRNVLAVRIFDHFGDGGFTGAAGDLFLSVK